MPKAREGATVPFERPLAPLTGLIRPRAFLVFDVESQNDERRFVAMGGVGIVPGFTHPFLVGFLDHAGGYHAFWTTTPPEAEPDFRKRATRPGGCVDAFMRHLLGHPKRDGRRHRFHPEWTADKADVWAHNGGRFDATFALVWLFRHRDEFETRVTSVQGKAQAVTIGVRGRPWKKKTTIRLLDSAFVLKMKLSEATSLFSGSVQKETDFALCTNNQTPVDRAKWEHYNAADCRGLAAALRGFSAMIEREGGALGTTAPATAMQLFRRRFLKRTIDRAVHFPGCEGECLGCDRGPHCDGACHGCLHAWIRRGYVGGNTQVFNRFAPSPIYYYDLNSSYPASMLQLMPVGKPLAIQGADAFFREHVRRRKVGQLAFVECKVRIPADCPLPPLPMVVDGKLKFQAGVVEGVFEYDELMCALDPWVGGEILEITRAVWFRGQVIFKEFVDTMYRYRLAGAAVKAKKKKNPAYEYTAQDRAVLALAEWAKLMMNALYGKFAMNPEREEIVFVGPNAPWPEHARPIDGRHEDCPVWATPRYVAPSYIVPQWSARITALSRIALWRAMVAVLRAGGVVHYCDTDSVVQSIPMPEALVDDAELGKWKRESIQKLLGDAGYDTQGVREEDYGAEFVVPKTYALFSDLDDRAIVHMKGVPRHLQNLSTFRSLVAGEELRVEKDRTAQHKSVLRGMAKGTGPDGIYMVDSVKRLRSRYDKRIVLDDGSTVPIVREG